MGSLSGGKCGSLPYFVPTLFSHSDTLFLTPPTQVGVVELDGTTVGSTTVAQLASALLCAETGNPASAEDVDAVAAKKRAIVQLCTDGNSWAGALAVKGLLKAR